MIYRIEVVPDDCKPKRFMVLIWDTSEHRRDGYVPLRGVTQKAALEAVKPLRYAFGYGAQAMKRAMAEMAEIEVETYDD
jgi:hypothetical protein